MHQVMAGRQDGVSPLSYSMLPNCNLVGPFANIFVKFGSKYNHFIQENEVEHVVWKMAFIWSRPRRFNVMLSSYHDIFSCEPSISFFYHTSKRLEICGVLIQWDRCEPHRVSLHIIQYKFNVAPFKHYGGFGYLQLDIYHDIMTICPEVW